MRVRFTPLRTLGSRAVVLSPALGALFPRQIIYVNFFVPVPAILFAGGYVAWDLYNAWTSEGSTVSHAGHLGGACAVLALLLPVSALTLCQVPCAVRCTTLG